MTKEIYISSTPHETRLALVEDDQLAEIYYERENEYTLAGSIYKGRVTRVLPGMQSAFVDVGLERDAFLYVTDFIEETEDGDEIIALPQSHAPQESTRNDTRNDNRETRTDNRNAPRGENRNAVRPPTQEAVPAEGTESDAEASGEQGQGARRWRGRRGRRRSNDRGSQQHQAQNPEHAPQGAPAASPEASFSPDTDPLEETNVVEAEMQQDSRHTSHSSERASHESGRASGRPPRREHHAADSPRESRDSRESSAAALILPGESLSKYRRGSEPAPATSGSIAGTTHAPTPAVSGARPSTLIETPLAWDGGLQLPGESLSRRRNPTPAKTVAVQPIEVAAASATPTAPAVEFAHTEAAAVETAVAEISAPTVVSTAVEYEPTEASASHLVDPTTPSAYRQSHVVEPETIIAATPAPTVLSTLEDAPPSANAPAEMLEDDEESSSNANLDEDANDDSSEATLHAFAPGTGVLEEELIDEEEDEAPAAYALLDESGLDELTEETLDVQMDADLLSDMVRDTQVEKRTRFQETPSGQTLDEATETESDEELSDDIDEEEISEDESDLSEEEDFPSEETADGDLAEGSSEEAGGTDNAARPTSARFGNRSRGRQQGNRRRMGGGHSGGQGGRGRRATAQMSNLPAITELLKSGQEILVQIAKEPIARKGARITSHIALPGRFLVFMPTVNHVGVSRKIASDEERQRLKRILISEKGDAGGGFIVRTAAATASEEDLRADIRFLLNLWADIRQRSESCKPPALIYHDLSLVERVLRDQVSENFSTIWVDTEADYERVLRFLQRFQPSLIRRVKLYTKETPLFEQFGIQEEINKALRSKVWLKSGGSIVINQTEALVAIDINTGKYVGKTARLEDTILKTNLDAIPEIVRQIRLRDLGGIIVIDFIDMDERKNRNRVMQALEEELKSDRAPSKVLQFNDFGLVAITRKRVKQSLERTLSIPCNVCTGTGMVKSPITVCNEIYIELRKMHRHLERQEILLRVHPEVVKHLKLNNASWLGEMEELSGKTVIVKSDPSLHPEQYDIH